MFLKVIIFAVVAFLIYRFFGGKIPRFSRTTQQQKLDEDTLVECTQCSTYVTVKESIIANGTYYCSVECKK